MTYDLRTFSELRDLLDAKLTTHDGEPLSCELYECSNPTGKLSLIAEDGKEIVFHVAEACNIANLVLSIDRILSSPRSNKGCAQLSDIFLVNLDILREYIRAALPSDWYAETDADKNVRFWAGFIKHPRDYVFAHRCLADMYENLDPAPAVINSDFLSTWHGLSNSEKDRKKADLAHRVVEVQLPSISEISDFFTSCSKHLQKMIELSRNEETTSR
ncbi:hypothetical protein [Thalassococcus lentus]|uniref:Uncharacterized protein n=1 Tax=Thalassococcus lentus TaxID=1210524 RepID=A0ABT4XUD6_9RHOB|nr:hypothetical protein [Thalassococcus lentus]MDA7425575.1 hypothetical protein [Thalassococcus lentus]